MNQEDRELLKLAAKAASVECLGITANGIKAPAKHLECGYDYWNPLTDDGDALRLAVKLRIDVCRPSDDAIIICAWDGNDFCEEPLGSDHSAATRRAIVRAAAEIGKAMPRK